MSESVNNIALGNYKDLIKDCRSDELGTLAQGINTMSQEISKYLSKIKSHNNALNDAIDKANAANNAKSIFLSITKFISPFTDAPIIALASIDSA